jgi:hypothetical protein
MAIAWAETKDDGVLLRLQIQPRASRSAVAGPHGEPPRLKIRVAAPPVDGAANEELVAFLSKALGIPKSRIRIFRGEKGKAKDVLCSGARLAEVLAALAIDSRPGDNEPS